MADFAALFSAADLLGAISPEIVDTPGIVRVH